MRQATYRIIRFPLGNAPARYVGLAWNYEQAVLLSTHDYSSYTAARAALDGVCGNAGVELRWFDGFYQHEQGQLVPADASAGLPNEHPESVGS